MKIKKQEPKNKEQRRKKEHGFFVFKIGVNGQDGKVHFVFWALGLPVVDQYWRGIKQGNHQNK